MKYTNQQLNEEIDKEIKRLKENRKRYVSYKKEKEIQLILHNKKRNNLNN